MLETERDNIRKHFLKYTRQAFQGLPKMESPHILDVGCGSGIPTIELAKLSGGQVTGIDVDQSQLSILNERIVEEGLSRRVFVRNCSLFDIDFPDETFDVIWAEGSLHIVGFEKGLKEWRHLLKSGGFLVAHDGIKDVSSKLDRVPVLGYKLVTHFALPEDTWQTKYFEPLEQLIQKWRNKAKTPETLSLLESYQNEVNMYKMNPKENVSAFYIFQKT
jgi:ubiquinone/menaquinone biosynthesis C-methylase UbiE